MRDDHWFEYLNILEEDRALIRQFELEPKEPINPSRRHKIRMNRIFRMYAEDIPIPFPEVDSCYERMRSVIIKWLKT